MPIIRSAKKKLRQDKKRKIQNSTIKISVQKIIKKYKSHPTPILLSEVFSILDMSAKKKIFHINKVSRLKSNLSKLLGIKPSKSTITKVVAQKTPPKKRVVKKLSK